MKHWGEHRLGDLVDILSGFAFDSENFADSGEMPIVRIRDVVRGRSSTFYKGEFDQKYVLRDGDMLIGMDGEFNLARWQGGPALLNQRVCRIAASNGVLDDGYLFRFLRGALKAIEDVTPYVTVKHLSVKTIRDIEIPLPPLAEQRRIAEVLDRAEALRAKRRAALAQLDSLTQSLFLDLFGDPVSNPKGVKVVRLADVATRITDGVHQKPNYTESGVPFISVKDITTGKLIFDDCKFISAEDHERFTKRCKPERLDILYTKVGATYGRPAIVETDREFSLYVSVCIIKPRKDLIDPHFLNAALGTPAVKNQADRRIKGIGVPDLHLDQIQSFLIPLPSMSQQREFARRVTVVEALKKAQRASLAELDALFATLQHRAFRGEL